MRINDNIPVCVLPSEKTRIKWGRWGKKLTPSKKEPYPKNLVIPKLYIEGFVPLGIIWLRAKSVLQQIKHFSECFSQGKKVLGDVRISRVDTLLDKDTKTFTSTMRDKTFKVQQFWHAILKINVMFLYGLQNVGRIKLTLAKQVEKRVHPIKKENSVPYFKIYHKLP